MRYVIEVGDTFLCKKDYVMDDESTAYKKGKKYISEIQNCITDEQGCDNHDMSGQDDFFEYFDIAKPTKN
jgi:hypothetical protein